MANSGTGGMLISIDASELEGLGRAFQEVPPQIRAIVIPRSLNDVGDGVFTLTKRTVAKITGAKPGKVAATMQKMPASAANPQFTIKSRSPWMSLKDFGPRQGKKGVSAAPWAKRRVFGGTFLGPGGHVYKRVGPDRLPVEKLWGPNIAKEMVREENAAAVRKLIAERLPGRVIFWTERVLASTAKQKGDMASMLKREAGGYRKAWNGIKGAK